ncbi:MAG: SusC/RagA family TonB-linked outer membrane protein [Phaeodactylibacter sp.]|nr:SusC/RagA family TonB-linked outer membrane protein [Phaeodactylibacter sp.]MCB9050996.1 SusC/RagA family TonB-linked outer membrane protein [Lewinellaceae bacterium]
MKKCLLVLPMMLFALCTALAQRTVTGTVSDTRGEPLIGSSVLVKGTTTGTVTDVDGSYSLIVPQGNNILVFSYTGYEPQEIELGASNIIDVTLRESSELLDEVVVTAVGLSANKSDLGYSIQSVKADDVNKSGETNLVAALAGKAAGVQVASSGGTAGAAAQIRIRGNKTIIGNNSPLFVVDGVPIDNSTFTTADSPEDAVSDLGSGGVNNSNRAIDINPNDIASMTVLKGPAATALYGIRAANGAIVITTKRGVAGKPRIRISSSITLDEVNKLPEIQKEYSQGNPVDGVPTFESPMTGSFTGFSWGAPIADLRYADVESMWDRNGLIVHKDDPRATNRIVNAYDNPGDFFETANTFNNHVSVSGGNDRVTYYMSGGNLSQTGIVPNTDFSRTSFKATIGANLTDRLKTTFSANYIRSGGKRAQNGSNTSGVMLGLMRTAPTFDNRNGLDPDKDPLAYQFEDGRPRSYRGLLGDRAIYDNPYWTVYKNFLTDNVNRMIGFAQASYEWADGFTTTARLGVDTYSDFRKFRNDIGSGTLPAGQVVNHNINSTDLNVDVLGTYKKELSPDLDVNATVGWNFYRKEVENRREDGQSLASRGFFNIASASSVSVVERPTQKELFGVYGDVRLSYKNMLFLNLTGRNDWSSTLPESNNSFFYPAVALGWTFTESFGIQDGFFSYGKLRASYGKVGNDAPFALTTTGFAQARVRDGWTTPNGVIFPALGTNSFIPDDILGNDELKPEFTTTFEVGADLRFLNNRVSADITYFRALSQDVINLVDISRASGFLQRAINTGEIENQGVEAVLSGLVVDNGDFSYEVGLNFNKYTSVVNEIAPGLNVITIDPFGTQRIQVGEPYGIFFGTRFLRDDQGRMVIDPSDGMPLQDPVNGKVGDPTPDFTLGFRNSFSYKGASLSFLFDWKKGGDVYNGTSGVINNFGVGIETLDRNDRVVFDGVLADENGNPTDIVNTIEVVKGGTDGGTNFYQNYGFVNLDELTVMDGGYFRLRDVNLSYTIPSRVFGGAIQSLSITLSARNVFLITDYTGIDPETNLTGDASNVFSYDYFNNPNTRSYGLKLDITL